MPPEYKRPSSIKGREPKPLPRYHPSCQPKLTTRSGTGCPIRYLRPSNGGRVRPSLLNRLSSITWGLTLHTRATSRGQSAVFGLAAPEGFWATFPHPARTCSGLAERSSRLLVSIITFQSLRILYHRIKGLSSTLRRNSFVKVHQIG